MKRNILALLTISALCLFASCEKNDGDNSAPELVAAEIVPGADMVVVDLGDYTPIDLIWTPGSWNGEGEISYKVVIDKENGDFSEPILSLNPLKGTLSVYLTKNDMRTVWEAVRNPEVEKDTAMVKWAVESSAAGKVLRSSSALFSITETIIVKKVDFEVGMSVYTAGEGSTEPGMEMSCIYSYPFVTGGNFNDAQSLEMPVDYEIFTKIEAGKPFVLTYGDKADEPYGYINIAGAQINEVGIYDCSYDAPQECFTAANDGIYRIRLNTTDKQVLIQEVTAVKIRCFGREMKNGKWQQANTTDFIMKYIGGGSWGLDSFDIIWGNSSYDKRYDTYKFCVSLPGGDQLYGALEDGNADNPTKETDIKYWGMRMVVGGAVVGKGAFRFPIWLLSADKNPAYSADIRLYLNLNGCDYYRHEFVNETAK
ncbi:MAG: hypothetical protein ACI3ZN_05030 [Candidatus Cryptobacteroides sp.]